MSIEKKLNALAATPGLKTKIQKARGKRAEDSTRDIPVLIAYAKQIDAIFAALNVRVTLKDVPDEIGFLMQNVDDQTHYTRMAEMLINNTFKAQEHMNDVIQAMQVFIDDQKYFGREVKTCVQNDYLILYSGEEPHY